MKFRISRPLWVPCSCPAGAVMVLRNSDFKGCFSGREPLYIQAGWWILQDWEQPEGRQPTAARPQVHGGVLGEHRDSQQ